MGIITSAVLSTILPPLVSIHDQGVNNMTGFQEIIKSFREESNSEGEERPQQGVEIIVEDASPNGQSKETAPTTESHRKETETRVSGSLQHVTLPSIHEENKTRFDIQDIVDDEQTCSDQDRN